MKEIQRFILLFIAILAVQLMYIPVYAVGEGSVIEKIQIKGSKRTEDSTIIS